MMFTIRRAVQSRSALRSFASSSSTSAVVADQPSSTNMLALSKFHEPVYLGLTSLLPVKKGDNPKDQVACLDPSVFNHPTRRDILHLCVIQHLDGIRQGSANTKTRGEVRGSGRKIRPQKGSGKARLGDAYSPMLRGGGVAFGPKPRDFSTKLPRKVIAMGMRVALTAKVREQRLGLVKSLEWDGVKTKHLAQRIKCLGWTKTLFVTGEDEVPLGLKRSSGNIEMIGTTTAKELTVYDVLKWQRIVMDMKAVNWFTQTLGNGSASAESAVGVASNPSSQQSISSVPFSS